RHGRRTRADPPSIRAPAPGRSVGSRRWKFRPRRSPVPGPCDYREGRGGSEMMKKTRRWPLRYGFALLAVAAAVGLALVPVSKPAGGSLLLMAVLLSAWVGGLRPGLFNVAPIRLLPPRDHGPPS